MPPTDPPSLTQAVAGEGAVRLTEVRRRVLMRLLDGEWHLWDEFTSAEKGPPRSLLRRTMHGRRGRILPWNATAAPLVTTGYMESQYLPGWRVQIRITDLGRAALRKGGET